MLTDCNRRHRGSVCGGAGPDGGDLRILHRTVRELRYASSLFERYRNLRKLTVFGSARTQPDTPIYRLAAAFAQRITEAGFMVITGAEDSN